MTDKVFDHMVRPYVKFEGEVEIRWGDGHVQDLLDYMNNDQEFLEFNGEFDPDMCKKDYKANIQTILWCHACSCEQKQMGTLVNHIQGKKHINKVMEYRRIHQGIEKAPPQQPRAKKAKTALPKESDAKHSLTELLQRYPTDTALGLEYIHEWNPPTGRGLKWYTCSLKGCKSAWGKSFEMAAHLIGNRNKHSRNYLQSIGVPDAIGLTQDKLLAVSREEDQKQRGFHLDKDRDYSQIVRHYDDHKMYNELVNRPKDWSESKAKRKREIQERQEEDFRCINDIIKQAKQYLLAVERADDDGPTIKTLEYMRTTAKSTIVCIKTAKELARELQVEEQRESLMSQCTRVREKLKKVETVSTFKLDVDHTVRSLLRPYFINAGDPEKVRIPSQAKFEQQAAYLASKVVRAEMKTREWENLEVRDHTRQAIGKLVEDSMKNFKQLVYM